MGKRTCCALDNGDRAAQAADCLRHLDSDRTASQNEQVPRDSLHAGDLAVRPNALEPAQTGNRRNERIRAGGQHNVVRGAADTVNVHHARAREPPTAAKQGDTTIREPALLTGIGVIRDDGVAPGECCIDVDFRLRCGLTSTVDGLAWTQQRLRWDARPIRAFATDELTLNQRDTQATFSERADTVLARRTAANDDHVVVVHCGTSSPPRLP